MPFKICQMSCNVEERSLKDFWKILFICDLVKSMRSLVSIRSVLWRMFFDFLVPRWSLSCSNFGTMLLSLQRFKNPRLDRFLAREVLSLLKVFTLARILSP